jgi:hypothetical protein
MAGILIPGTRETTAPILSNNMAGILIPGTRETTAPILYLILILINNTCEWHFNLIRCGAKVSDFLIIQNK